MDASEERTKMSEQAENGMCLDCGATFPTRGLLDHHRAVAHPRSRDPRIHGERPTAAPRSPDPDKADEVPPSDSADATEETDPARSPLPRDPRMRAVESERASEMDSEGRQVDTDLQREAVPDVHDTSGFERSNRPRHPYGRTSTASGSADRREGSPGNDPSEPSPRRNPNKPGQGADPEND